MEIPKFRVGMVVNVKASKKDPGGIMGRITAVKTTETAGGRATDLRIDIKGNPKQDAARAAKGEAHQGFWYDAALIEE
jgi:hypothetical protein